MKKRYLAAIAAFIVITASSLWAVYSGITSRWAILGEGSLANTALAYIDSEGDFFLYKGDVNLGDSGTTPSTSSGAYPGLLVPFYNASGTTIVEGNILIASTTATSLTGAMTIGTALATTTVMGIAAETVASGAVGKMRVDGWAIVLTTGVVNIGDLIVTTNTVRGYAGRLSPGTSELVGDYIGKAAQVGTPAGGYTLVILE